MKKDKSVIMIITLISVVAAMVATLTTLWVYNDKKRRDDQELERYLNDSIL